MKHCIVLGSCRFDLFDVPIAPADFDRLLVDIRTEYFLDNVVIGFLQFLVELLLELVFEG